MPPTGWIYTDITAPLDYNMEETRTSGLRSGRAETMSVLRLVALGDASINAAARSGNLQTVHHADYEYFNVLFVYERYRTIVYGE